MFIKNSNMESEWYFIDKLGNKKGPFTIEELRLKINKNTLVWEKYMDDWTIAEDVSLLKDFFNQSPPPTPKEKQNSKSGSYSFVEKPKKLSKYFREAKYRVYFFIIVSSVYFRRSAAFYLNHHKLDRLDIFKEFLYKFAIIYALVFILIALKKYLNQLNNYYRVNKILNGIIFFEVLSVSTSLLLSRFKISETTSVFYQFIDYTHSFSNLIGMTLMIVLSIRLLKIENDYSGLIKAFAITMLLGGFLVIIFILMFLVKENDSYLALILLARTLPFITLGLLFRSAQKQLKKEV